MYLFFSKNGNNVFQHIYLFLIYTIKKAKLKMKEYTKMYSYH